MWTDAFHLVSFQEKCLFFLFFHPYEKCHGQVLSRSKKFFPRPRIPMKRFMSSRSSSQQELQPVEDLRAERAAIALSVGLSWPPDRYTKTPRGRPTWQQLWERALQEHIMNHHDLPQGIRLQRPGRQTKPSTGRSYTRSSPTSRRLVPPRPPRPLKTSPAAVHRSAARSTSTPSPATGSLTCWTSGRPSGDGTCGGACARSSACAPGCSTGSTRALLIAGSGARHEQRRLAGEECCRPQTRRGSASTS